MKNPFTKSVLVGSCLLLSMLSMPAFSQQAILSHANHWRMDVAISSDLSAKIDTFFGTQKGHYLASGGRASSQFKEALLSMDLPDQPQPDGGMLISGFKVHEAGVRAALLLDQQGNIRSAALIHFACSDQLSQGSQGNPEPHYHPVCASHDSPVLTIFVPKYVATDPDIKIFRDWSLEQAKADRVVYSKDSFKFKNQVVQLAVKK